MPYVHGPLCKPSHQIRGNCHWSGLFFTPDDHTRSGFSSLPGDIRFGGTINTEPGTGTGFYGFSAAGSAFRGTEGKSPERRCRTGRPRSCAKRIPRGRIPSAGKSGAERFPAEKRRPGVSIPCADRPAAGAAFRRSSFRNPPGKAPRSAAGYRAGSCFRPCGA